MSSYKSRILLLLICLTMATPSTQACKFCNPMVGQTLLTDLDTSQTAVLAELVRSPDPKLGKHGTTGYRVSVVLKGQKSIKVGDTFDVPLAIQAPVGAVHLFTRNPDGTTWQYPRGLSPEGIKFMQKAAELPEINEKLPIDDRVKRLACLFPYLDSSDPELVRAAYGEFAAAPYSAVKELKPLLNHHQLILQIDHLKPSAETGGLLFTLLSVCDNPDDLIFVEDELNERLEQEKTRHLDAIIATYLTLRGPEGLAEIDRRILQQEDVPVEITRAAVNALRFHADVVQTIDRQQIITRYRKLLDDPKTADLVMGDLARYEDWESLDEVLALWNGDLEKHRWLKQPILEYLKACPEPGARSTLASIERP